MNSSVIWSYPFSTSFVDLFLLLEERILDFCTELCVKVCCGVLVISYMSWVASVCVQQSEVFWLCAALLSKTDPFLF